MGISMPKIFYVCLSLVITCIDLYGSSVNESIKYIPQECHVIGVFNTADIYRNDVVRKQIDSLTGEDKIISEMKKFNLTPGNFNEITFGLVIPETISNKPQFVIVVDCDSSASSKNLMKSILNENKKGYSLTKISGRSVYAPDSNKYPFVGLVANSKVMLSTSKYLISKGISISKGQIKGITRNIEMMKLVNSGIKNESAWVAGLITGNLKKRLSPNMPKVQRAMITFDFDSSIMIKSLIECADDFSAQQLSSLIQGGVAQIALMNPEAGIKATDIDVKSSGKQVNASIKLPEKFYHVLFAVLSSARTRAKGIYERKNQEKEPGQKEMW